MVFIYLRDNLDEILMWQAPREFKALQDFMGNLVMQVLQAFQEILETQIEMKSNIR